MACVILDVWISVHAEQPMQVMHVLIVLCAEQVQRCLTTDPSCINVGLVIEQPLHYTLILVVVMQGSHTMTIP